MIYLVIGKIFVHKYLRSLKIGEQYYSGVLLIRVLIVTTLCLQLFKKVQHQREQIFLTYRLFEERFDLAPFFTFISKSILLHF